MNLVFLDSRGMKKRLFSSKLQLSLVESYLSKLSVKFLSHVLENPVSSIKSNFDKIMC